LAAASEFSCNDTIKSAGAGSATKNSALTACECSKAGAYGIQNRVPSKSKLGKCCKLEQLPTKPAIALQLFKQQA